jgi:drug/metabolite transporter (DMT)-like permease
MFLLGVLAALFSPFMMTVGFIIWDDKWKGSAFALNMFKCSLASFLFLVSILLFQNFDTGKYLSMSSAMLVLSSILGIVIGDNTWLQALQILGARRVIVVDSVKPFMAAILGAVILDEHISALSVCGMILTCTGVLVVSLEETEEVSDHTSDKDTDNQEEQIMFNRHLTGAGESEDIEGILLEGEDMLTTLKDIFKPCAITNTQAITGYSLALLNVILDAYGSILTKQYGAIFSTWEINLIRFGFASVVMGAVSVMAISYYSIAHTNADSRTSGNFEMISSVSSDNGESDREKADSVPTRGENSSSDSSLVKTPSWYSMPFSRMTIKGWALVTLGVCFVTYICPSLANYALFQMNVALCLTLTSLGPLYSLPLVWLMKNEKVTSMGILGTFVAFVGVVMLCYSEGNQAQSPEIDLLDDQENYYYNITRTNTSVSTVVKGNY